MKRLTYEGNYCDIALCDPGESACPKGGCRARRLWERLKAYEDTGLTPEEVRRVQDGNSQKLQGVYVRQRLP